MNVLELLNSDLVFPILALFVVIIYAVNRIKMRRKFKR